MRMKSKLAAGLCIAMILPNLPIVSMAELAQQTKETEIYEEKESTGDLEENWSQMDGIKIVTPSDAEEEIPGKEMESEKDEEIPEASKEEEMESQTQKNQLLLERAVVATPTDAVEVTNEAELQKAVKNSGTIVVEGEIALTETLEISDGKEIDLRGGRLTYAGNNRQKWMIYVQNAKVTLSDITIDMTGMDCELKVSDTDNRLVDYYAISSNADSEIYIEEGTEITSGDKYSDLKNTRKSGVWFGGIGEMNGGTVYGLAETALKVGRGAQFTMNDGELTKNAGGGIVITGGQKEGTGIIKGGRIVNNDGSGVFNSGKLIFSGGELSNNYSGILSLIHISEPTRPY